MKCKDFKEEMSLYIDGMLDKNKKNEFEKHLKECSKCRKEYKEMMKILNHIKKEEEVELPKNYKKELRSKLESEKKTSRKIKFKPFMGLAAGLVVILMSVTLYNNYLNNDKLMQGAKNEEFSYDKAAPENSSITQNENKNESKKRINLTSDDNNMKNINTDRKIIREAYLQIEIKSYDNTLEKINNYITKANGYVENVRSGYDIDYRTKDSEDKLKKANLTLRVPEEKFDDTIKYLDNLGKINTKRVTRNDISNQYFDTKNTIKNLKIQEERLREILKKADKIEDILQIENELRRIRKEIDRYTGTIKNWDRLVSMSTINIELTEVKYLNNEIKSLDKGIWFKAKEGFISTVNLITKGIEGIIIGLITISPLLILIGSLLVIFILIRRYLVNKS
ncbi:MAG: DUF4349 domain-containing protein [Firmicutes bacterium]|nr:DUF4349 domain-containing protein [Bacillota bacterium]